MDFLTLAKQRCSVRKYKKEAVEKEKLEKLLEAARVAPTAANAQSQRILVINSSEGLEKLSKGVNFHGAPLALIVCGDHSSVFVRPFDKKDMVSVDATIVADHIVLEAEDLGLSSCWLTYFDPEVIRAEFHIPEQLEPVAIIALGYADTEKASPDRHEKARKALDEIVFYGTF
ncbi:MAG: nitroreductase family protein [Lachnospiraceae bacterium]|nr:nitroreductase family protein [Lachnospiraceae bacterium]MBP3611010.1 nitroreductase family protein [Lachnospiraceae bacterium]